jgi:ribosomal protein S18 acetylase RimI-like enzyme
MVHLEKVTVEGIAVFKAIRLRALQESPSAFGSTYQREAQFSDEEWVKRATRWNGERGIGYLAMEEGEACGIAGALLEDVDPTRAQLVSMWTAPEHRQRGVGRLLVEGVVDWATTRAVRTLTLMVTSKNQAATLFYQRLGFTMTGRTEPYPNDAALMEYEMSLALE